MRNNRGILAAALSGVLVLGTVGAALAASSRYQQRKRSIRSWHGLPSCRHVAPRRAGRRAGLPGRLVLHR